MQDTNIGRVAALWRYPVQSLRGERVASYDVPTSLELEDRTLRPTHLWRILPPA